MIRYLTKFLRLTFKAYTSQSYEDSDIVRKEEISVSALIMHGGIIYMLKIPINAIYSAKIAVKIKLFF